MLRDFFPSPPQSKCLHSSGENSHWEGKKTAKKPIFSPRSCSVTALSPPHPPSLLLLRCMQSPRSGPHSPKASFTHQWHIQAKCTQLSQFLIPPHCFTAVQYLHHAHIASFPVDFTFTEQKKMITFAILLNTESNDNTIYIQHKNKNANRPQNTTFFGTVSDLSVNNPSTRVWKKQLLEPNRGAFASLTSHTLFFQMNLGLFLSKSPQK